MKIQFVLVEPKVPENIGASARALKTMGFHDLVLVNPCEWQEGKSKWVAYGSFDILEKALIFKNLQKAVSDSDFVVATSAKKRTVRQDYVNVRDLREFIGSKSGSAVKVSIVFGREESGLTNDEMKLCDITTSITMANKYPSLNLSQAVMIVAYELSGLNFKPAGELRSADEISGKVLKDKVKEILINIGIGENDNRHGRIMERISFLENTDINLVHSICNLLIETTDKKNKS
jgi:tRNA/rRNA methyltransferase